MFLAVGFLIAGFFAAFLAAGFLAAVFVAGFLAAGFLAAVFWALVFLPKKKTKQIRERESIFAPLPVQIRCDTGRTAKRGPSHMAGAGDICITAPKFAHKGFSSDFKQSNHKLYQTESKTWLF